jgi:SET domain
VKKQNDKDVEVGYYYGRLYQSVAEFELLSGGKWRRDYLMTNNDKGTGATVNAAEGCNIFRYVNHSNTPNCSVVWVAEYKFPRIVTNRIIYPGEYLSFNYHIREIYKDTTPHKAIFKPSQGY